MRHVCLFIVLGMMSCVCLGFSATPKEAAMTKQTAKNPTVLIKTSLGNITVELYADKAPISVKNFLQYVNEGQYNHTIFHRVIDGFMVQGEDSPKI